MGSQISGGNRGRGGLEILRQPLQSPVQPMS